MLSKENKIMIGVCETLVVSCSGSAGSAAGFYVATCYPKSGFCKFNDFV